MFHGLCTVTLYAADLDAAAAWYAEVLGVEAYLQQPGYVEFRVGDHLDELGIIDARYAGSALARTAAPDPGRPAGTISYWHVDDVAGEVARRVGLGATILDESRDRGDGSGAGRFVTATVLDPFANVLGIMQNPHYVEMEQRANGAVRSTAGSR